MMTDVFLFLPFLGLWITPLSTMQDSPTPSAIQKTTSVPHFEPSSQEHTLPLVAFSSIHPSETKYPQTLWSISSTLSSAVAKVHQQILTPRHILTNTTTAITALAGTGRLCLLVARSIQSDSRSCSRRDVGCSFGVPLPLHLQESLRISKHTLCR